MVAGTIRRIHRQIAAALTRQKTLTMTSRAMKKRLETTCCTDCREKIKHQRRLVDAKLDAVNEQLHRLVLFLSD